MKNRIIFLVALSGLLFVQTFLRGQETNPPPVMALTKLEAFETNVGAIVLKATTDLGSVSTSSGVVSVRYKENTDTSTGRKEHGLAIEIARQFPPKDIMLIDDDELPSLLNAIDYLSKVDVGVTTLGSFDAAYTTKGGFRIAALGTRRTGIVQFGVRDVRTTFPLLPPLPLTRDEMTRLWTLIDQAKQQLDALQR